MIDNSTIKIIFDSSVGNIGVIKLVLTMRPSIKAIATIQNILRKHLKTLLIIFI